MAGLADIFKLGGAIAGGIAGAGTGPAGALAGASAGSQLGGAVGGFLDPAKAPAAPEEQKVRTIAAPQRRMDALQQVEQLKQAQAAVAQLPPAQQQDFEAPIREALQRAQQSIQQGSLR